MKIIEGDFATPKGRFAIVAGRFNGFVVEPLVAGARDALVRHGVKDDAIELVRVPGAWEVALAAHKLANSGKYVAVIALGAANAPRAWRRPPTAPVCRWRSVC